MNILNIDQIELSVIGSVCAGDLTTGEGLRHIAGLTGEATGDVAERWVTIFARGDDLKRQKITIGQAHVRVRRAHYRGYIIEENLKPIPVRDHDVDYFPEDYDGPEDGRGGSVSNLVEAMDAVDEELMEDE